MNVQIIAKPNADPEHWSIPLSELGLTVDEWDGMTPQAQKEAVNEYLKELEEPIHWVCDHINGLSEPRKKQENA